MGRKRNDASQGLPKRVYLRSGSFYYVHLDTGKWEPLGKDLATARKRAEHYADPTGTYGTMTWFLDQFIIDCEQRVLAKSLAQRTLNDYLDAMPALKAYFGAMLPTEVEPHHVNAFLKIGAETGRAVRANREKAALSSCMSWMLRSPNGNAGLRINPCMRASGIVRNPEKKRERYVTDAEYNATFEAANRPVRLAMELVYRTLQRPQIDVLAWTPSNIKRKSGADVLHFRQHKTGKLIDIALTGPLGELVKAAVGDVPKLRQPILHTLAGEAYTYDGISSMLRRAQEKARKKVRALKDMPSFGLRDLKGKGATDMWLDGVPIEQIQLLCGHADKKTTEIYIKQRWTQTAQPNAVKVGA